MVIKWDGVGVGFNVQEDFWELLGVSTWNSVFTCASWCLLLPSPGDGRCILGK